MIKLILLSIFLIILTVPSRAQFVGFRIGIPANHNYATIGGGGGGIPNNAMTFNGAYMTFNGAYMTFSGTP